MSSHSRKKVLIAVYGDQDDRARAKALADMLGMSQSEMMLVMLRERYKKMFGTLSVQDK